MTQNDKERLFEELRKEGLLAICEECGDGNETHQIDEHGLCYRHDGFSISAARRKVFECIENCKFTKGEHQ